MVQVCADSTHMTCKTDFPNISFAIATLMVETALPDMCEKLKIVYATDPLVAILYFTSLAVSTYTILNLLIGVLVSMVGNMANAERDRADMLFVKDYFLRLFFKNCEGTGMIDKAEFK